MSSVLITGSSKGIGMATALVLARAGHTVFATMRSPSKTIGLAQIAKKESLPIFISAMDVDDDNSVAEGISVIQQERGPIDVLVNNAGIEIRGSIEELELSAIRAVMETNYFGAIRCIKAVLPEMRKRRDGCIINITSVAGRISSSPLGAYSASKFALESLSESLAQEAKMYNIRVAIVEPGIIDTAMARRITEPSGKSHYPHTRRFQGLFSASLENPTSPMVVAEKIQEIINSGTWKLRHPAGPDAAPFLEWRAAMKDEEWIHRNAASDHEWYNAIENDFGLNARPKEDAATKS